ncbi:hypothetical protein MAH1_28550 [Sessilibacter sp. MAH1]
MLVRISLFLALVVFAAAGAQATTVSFGDWVYNTTDQIDWQVSVDDESNEGYFTFNIDIGDQTLTGDVIGFGFNSELNFGSSGINLDLVESFTDGVAFGNCRGACNFNGTGINPEYAFSVGALGQDFVSRFSFGLPTFGATLTANTFSLTAIRALQVGDDRENSVKDYSATATVVAVPELNGNWAVIVAALLLSCLLLKQHRTVRLAPRFA